MDGVGGISSVDGESGIEIVEDIPGYNLIIYLFVVVVSSWQIKLTAASWLVNTDKCRKTKQKLNISTDWLITR